MQSIKKRNLNKNQRSHFGKREPPKGRIQVWLWSLAFFFLAAYGVAFYKMQDELDGASIGSIPQQKQKQQLQTHHKHEKEWFDGDVVHIVYSRFMQHQGNLTKLAMARKELFQTFCLPTMIHQTNPNFLWIIRADPGLDPSITSSMITLLKPYSNFLLVTSLSNDQGFDLGFREKTVIADVLNEDNVLSGDVNLARKFHAAAQSKIVLETRLDADDGLQKGSVDYLQTSARSIFVPSTSEQGTKNVNLRQNDQKRATAAPKWLYWCAKSRYDWHPHGPDAYGMLTVVSGEHDSQCITAGLTMGYPPGVNPTSTVPMFPHHRLHNYVHECEQETQTECMVLLQKKDGIYPWSIRARTPTSAGMKDIDLDGKKVSSLSSSKQQHLWETLKADMGIAQMDASRTRGYIDQHLSSIALENLKGQCTSGHSCKGSTRHKLEKLMQSAAGDADK